MATLSCASGRREAAASHAGLARPTAGRGCRRAMDDRGPRRIKREGQARAWVTVDLANLARRFSPRTARAGTGGTVAAQGPGIESRARLSGAYLQQDPRSREDGSDHSGLMPACLTTAP